MENLLSVLQNTWEWYRKHRGYSKDVTEHMDGLLKVIQIWGSSEVFGGYCRKHGRPSDCNTKTQGGSSKSVANTWRVF
jgi:hypothetical protein